MDNICIPQAVIWVTSKDRQMTLLTGHIYRAEESRTIPDNKWSITRALWDAYNTRFNFAFTEFIEAGSKPVLPVRWKAMITFIHSVLTHLRVLMPKAHTSESGSRISIKQHTTTISAMPASGLATQNFRLLWQIFHCFQKHTSENYFEKFILSK